MTGAPDTRMLALVSDAYGGHGGVAQYNRDFFGAAARSGLFPQINVLPRHASGPVETPAGVTQLRARRSRVSYVGAALWIALTRRFDVIMCGHMNLALLAHVAARLCGGRTVYQMHGIEAWERPGRLYRAAVEAADLVLCVSRYTRARVLGWASMAPERVRVVPNTVNDAFCPGDRMASRARWGLDGKIVLLTVARMAASERYKGQDRVIRALPRLVEAGHDVVYLVLGDGDDEAQLRALADSVGVADRVRFDGKADRATLIDAYRMADLFVMPSTGEGFGIVFLEAMASGTPALGLAVGGATDALGDGELGTATNDDEFIHALARMISAPRPDSGALTVAVQARFGREPFARAVGDAMLRSLGRT